jgi:MFS family permease
VTHRGDTDERRLIVLVGAVVFVDTMFYAAIAPLLPALAHQFHLSKLSAGVMTAGYPLGTLAGSLPGGLLAARAGPRFTVCAGLALLAVSTLAFGLLDQPVLLDLARVVEGVGGACSWAGGLVWVMAEAPPARRGGLIGTAMGAAIGGALFGPVIGTVASGIGRAPTFTVVVVVALVLIDQARRRPRPRARSPQGLAQLVAAAGDRRMVGAMWLVALPALASGTINVLAPLRLHRLGASVAGVGAIFLVATAIEALISPWIGRLSDRRGRLAPLRAGLAAAGVLLLCFTLPAQPLLLGCAVVAIIAALGTFWAPAMAMLSDRAASRGLDQALAAALMNLAWAGGQVLGSGGGGAVAKVAGDFLPVSVIAGLCGITLLAVSARLLRGRAAG